ncbi:MAG: hypothetical protein ABFD82_11275, partial [Syntrophaceae bacterium]
TILHAAAIVLKGQEITGIITNIVPQTGGQDITVKQADDTLITFFVPNGMKIHLEGDGEIPANLLCVGREVRVLVNTSSTATLVKVIPETKEGTVTAIDASTRSLTVDLGGGITDTVVVSTGATILKSIGGVQSLISFGDIKAKSGSYAGDYIQYFGLKGCGTDTTFYAFVVVVTE